MMTGCARRRRHLSKKGKEGSFISQGMHQVLSILIILLLLLLLRLLFTAPYHVDILTTKTMAAATRHASHAGSWYSADKATLQSELDAWTHTVPDSIQGLGPVPQLGARVIIAP